MSLYGLGYHYHTLNFPHWRHYHSHDEHASLYTQASLLKLQNTFHVCWLFVHQNTVWMSKVQPFHWLSM